MKPFNLELAKAGRPVVTRDGRKAKIICTNAVCDYPIVALVEYPHPSPHEECRQFQEDGRYIDEDNPSGLDLFMATSEAEIAELKKPDKTAAQRFWELVYGTELKFDFEKYPNRLFGFRGDQYIWEYDFKNNHLWLRYTTTWSVLQKEFGLNYDDIRSLVKNQAEEHFKCKGVTPVLGVGGYYLWVEEHFKCAALEIAELKKPDKTAGQRFWELVSGTEVKFDFKKYPRTLFGFRDGEYVWEFDFDNGCLWLRNLTVWSVLEHEYSLNYSDVRSLVKKEVEEHFKCRAVTPFRESGHGAGGVEKHFKCKGVTPDSLLCFDALKVEEHFKHKGTTSNAGAFFFPHWWKSISNARG